KGEAVFEEGKSFAELRAGEAREAAEEYAAAQAELERLEAEAYADGIVSDEQDRAIEEARQNLEEAKQHAEKAASAAEDAAKIHADTKAQDAEDNAKAYAEEQDELTVEQVRVFAVTKEVYDSKMVEIADELSSKSSIEYVDGQLVDKANKG